MYMNTADAEQSTNSPLVLGVSGHRNLHPAEAARVKQRVAEFLGELRRRAPETELRIMVGMAQGADLLVAQAALSADWQVDAILPMPLERYVEDFDTESAAALLTLLENPAVHTTVLPAPAAANLASPGGPERDALYANLTEALIDKCNVLLALWNGQPSCLKGGTADTVLRYLGARSAHDCEESPIELAAAVADPSWGPHFVYWIPTMRSDDAAPSSHEPCYLSGIGENLLATHKAMPLALEHQLAELNAYNREYARLRRKGALGRLDSLMPALGQSDAREDHAALARIDAEYGKADALAIYYQQHSDRLFRWFSYMASCMALLFLVYAKLLASAALLTTYLTILVLSVVVFHFVRTQQWFSKHLIYRALAETMRTKFFLRAARADRLVSAAELINLTGIDQFSGFSWIGNLLKNVEPLHVEERRGVDDAARLESVHRCWIRGQQEYFSRRVRTLELYNRRLETMKSVMLFAMAALALFLLLFAGPLHGRVAGGLTWKDVVIFLMGLLPVLLGIWELYQNKMAMRELLWQYRNQLGHFTRAELQLSRTSAHDRHKEILAQVGKESLMESYLWTIHRYHREYEPPSVG
jgi:hypothetical protein